MLPEPAGSWRRAARSRPSPWGRRDRKTGGRSAWPFPSRPSVAARSPVRGPCEFSGTVGERTRSGRRRHEIGPRSV